jgi:peptide-methionine (R)-S-oxide reductase
MLSVENRSNILKLALAAVAIWAVGSALRPTPTAAAKTVPMADGAQRGAKVVKTEEEWRALLSPEQFYVLRQEGTERPGTGALLEEHRHGTFFCAGCGNPLFSWRTKFESGTGWPSFYSPVKGAVLEHADGDGSGRLEVECARCNSHLGHVFDDGPRPTGLRYCMNSVAMGFAAAK